MSQYYAETNGESTMRLFNKRTIYREFLKAQNHNNIIEMDGAEKILYGKVNKNFIPLVVTKDKLKNLALFDDQSIPPVAVNFVADLFNAMADQFKKCVQSGNIRPNDAYLSNLKAFKAYQDPLELYKTYQQQFFNSLAGLLLQEGVKINNFKDMVTAIMPILKSVLRFQPFTFTGFLKSKNCSVMSTGLAIEIADFDYINDHEKIQNFVKSPNWDFFVNTCDSYGFMVDLNIPWRITIDLNADCVLAVTSKYIETDSADKTLAYFYNNSSRYNFSFFKNTLFDLYNFIREEYVELFVCDDTGAIIASAVKPEQYTIDSYNEQFDDSLFVEIYTKLRLYEEMPDLDDEEVAKVVINQLEHFNSNPDLSHLFDFLESQINKTFDTEGCLGYIREGKKKRRLEDFVQETITNITVEEGANDFSGY
tara:strand:- start:1933 stop:3198 length:1266 start_codon:yes stop_codon:yes gene_type:complete